MAIVWRGEDRGAEFKPPTMRVYSSGVAIGHDGTCTWGRERYNRNLMPQTLEWNSNGKPSVLTLNYQLGIGPQQSTRARPEDARTDFAAGDRIVLQQLGRGEDDGGVGGLEWFRGHVGQDRITIQTQKDVEVLSLAAYGPEIRLKGKCVYGQVHKSVTIDEKEINSTAVAADRVRGSAVIFPTFPCILNEGGKPNCSNQTWELSTDGPTSATPPCGIFEVSERHVYDSTNRILAGYWTAYKALRMLVDYYDDYDVISTETAWAQIADMLSDADGDDLPVGTVNLEGPLTEALRRLLQPLGFGYALEPWATMDQGGAYRHRLLVFPLHGAVRASVGAKAKRIRTPAMAPIAGGNTAATDDEWRLAAVQRLDYLRDQHNVENDIRVLGDAKRTQIVLDYSYNTSTRDLQPFWDTSTHDLDNWDTDDEVSEYTIEKSGAFTAANFKAKYHTKGADYHDNEHVFRSFVWNEDGALSNVVQSAGSATLPDLSDYGYDSEYIRRPRPIGPTFTYSETQKAKWRPAIVQLGIYGESASWITLPSNTYKIMKDRAGLMITVEDLVAWRPYDNKKMTISDVLEGFRKYTYLTLLHQSIASNCGLQLRIIGSIECDDLVVGTASRRIYTAWPFSAQKVVRTRKRFEWRTVTDDHSAVTTPTADTVDGGTAATTYAERIRDVHEDAVGHGSLRLRGLHRDSYKLGQTVPRTSGREVDLMVDGGDALYAPVIVGIAWGFTEGANKTELILDTPQLRITP